MTADTTKTRLPRPPGLHGRPMTKKRLLNMVEEIVTEHPRRKNPLAAGSDPSDAECVYQSGDRRCIIGEVLHRLGADVSRLPQSTSIGCFTYAHSPETEVDISHWFTDNAAIMADYVQSYFDGNQQATWGRSWKALRPAIDSNHEV